jgi:hypothetical protein
MTPLPRLKLRGTNSKVYRATAHEDQILQSTFLNVDSCEATKSIKSTLECCLKICNSILAVKIYDYIVEPIMSRK